MPDDISRDYTATSITPPRAGARSTAAIAGHPLHPMLVPLPIGFLVGALLADLGLLASSDPFWARGAFWLIAAGIVGALLAAVFGLIDFLTIERARSTPMGWIHLVGNLTVVGLAVVNLAVRWSAPAASALPWGLVLSAVTVGLLLVTGWAGGELAYRHKVGVIDS